MRIRWLVLVVALILVGCAGDAAVDAPPTGRTTGPSPTPSTTASPEPSPSPTATAEVVEVRYRVERRTTDGATADFAEVVTATLDDPRGWERAGFDLVRDDGDAPYLVVLAEGDEVDRLCAPYDTAGTYSCQNGPVVALNADRWREATPEWTGDLASYRRMLVNHEVGHLLHLHHPVEPQCPTPGEPAPIMAQQSTELDGCLPNPWPLEWEIELAKERREPLAPPAAHDPSDHRPTPPAP